MAFVQQGSGNQDAATEDVIQRAMQIALLQYGHQAELDTLGKKYKEALERIKELCTPPEPEMMDVDIDEDGNMFGVSDQGMEPVYDDEGEVIDWQIVPKEPRKVDVADILAILGAVMG